MQVLPWPIVLRIFPEFFYNDICCSFLVFVTKFKNMSVEFLFVNRVINSDKNYKTFQTMRYLQSCNQSDNIHLKNGVEISCI